MNDREERSRQWMMAALDDEISDDDRRRFEAALGSDPELRAEWERLVRVKEITRSMRYRRPPDELWDRYWLSVYNRFERGLGWILFSVGAIVLLAWGVWHASVALWASTEAPPIVKVAVFALALGGGVLLLSVIRERLRLWRSDPYREVRR